MVRLQPDPFLNELTSMFERTTEKGSVWVTLKHSSDKSKVQRNKMKTAGEKVEYRCLIRATDGKKTISTLFRILIILKLCFFQQLHLHGGITLFTITFITLTLLLLSTESTQLPFACDTTNPQTNSLPFCQTTLQIHQRVEDLVSRLTLDEKISQLVNSAPAIPRLGIPAYEWWSEALHGVSGYGLGVSFNNGRISGATIFPQVILSASTFDARLWYRIGQAIGKEARAVYNENTSRHMIWIIGKALVVLDLMLKYITSDCDAVSTMHDILKYANVPEDEVADVLKAGMDVNCGSYLKTYTKSAIDHKKVLESEVDRVLHNLFAIRMRLGLFNGNPNKQLYGNIGQDQVCTNEHQELALEAARNGIVLLNNSAKLLPLSKSQTSSLAVIGPNATNAYALRGNYDGPLCKNSRNS